VAIGVAEEVVGSEIVLENKLLDLFTLGNIEFKVESATIL
jgi:hypothetical protein